MPITRNPTRSDALGVRGWLAAASIGYLANCALGASVATRLIDTHEIRWVHHALFTTTAALTSVTAVAAGVARRPRLVAPLAAALAVLALIPFVGTRTWRHTATALAAAPLFVGAIMESRR